MNRPVEANRFAGPDGKLVERLSGHKNGWKFRHVGTVAARFAFNCEGILTLHFSRLLATSLLQNGSPCAGRTSSPSLPETPSHVPRDSGRSGDHQWFVRKATRALLAT